MDTAKLPLRVLIVEDSEDDADLLVLELRRGRYAVTHRRVDTAESMREALAQEPWDVILCDFTMPAFDAPSALRVLKTSGFDIPVIIVSGTIGEETAIDALKAGASDFMVKGRFARLMPAIDRELREATLRRQRREVEANLASSELRFRTLVESIDDVVFTVDTTQIVTGVFGGAVKWRSQQTADFFVGKHVTELLPDEAGIHQRAIVRALAGDNPVYEWSGPDNRSFQSSLSPIVQTKWDGGSKVTGLVGVAREITEQRKLQTHLMVSDRMASVGLLAAGVAHEINNPLAAVIGNLDLAVRLLPGLRAGDDAGFTEFVEMLNDARTGADRVHQIVRDVKIFSGDRTTLKRGPVDVESVIESALRMARNEIRYRARIVKDFGKVPYVYGNESRLGQVFLNLILNAAQAIGDGTNRDNEIRIVTMTRGTTHVVVDVVDTGGGIPPEVMKDLFTPFFTTKPVGVGTGLGLSICRQIINAHDGEITVDSTVGRGTRFRISLPVTTGNPSVEFEAALVPRPPTRRGRVLVIDDEPMVTAALRRILISEHDVVTAGSAKDGMALLDNANAFDVIICDVMMPEATGIDFYASLCSQKPEYASRLIFLSGGVLSLEASSYLERLPNARIEKPFKAAGVRSLVNEHIV